MSVFAHVRASTSRQAEDGESLDVQQRTIAGDAMMHGLTVNQSFVEGGVSGSVRLVERPQGKAMPAALAAGDARITADWIACSAPPWTLGPVGYLKERRISLHMIHLGGDVRQRISKLLSRFCLPWRKLNGIASGSGSASRRRIKRRAVPTSGASCNLTAFGRPISLAVDRLHHHANPSLKALLRLRYPRTIHPWGPSDWESETDNFDTRSSVM